MWCGEARVDWRSPQLAQQLGPREKAARLLFTAAAGVVGLKLPLWSSSRTSADSWQAHCSAPATAPTAPPAY